MDLNKAKAVRVREAKRKAPVVKLGEEQFTLPVELPLYVVDLMVSVGDKESNSEIAQTIEDIVHVMLGDEQWARFYAIASREDVQAFTHMLGEEYGLDQGESTASAVS